jgi:uncharacterized repeat protein (TIGR03803 family)
MSTSRFGRLVLVSVFSAAFVAGVLNPGPALAQTPTTVYALPGGAGEPVSPDSWAIAQGRDGNLYVTTQYGGNEGPGGTVFNISPSGTPTEVESSIPWPFGLTLGTDGNFYGATIFGGTDGLGTVYKLTPGGVMTVLHSFTGGTDGDRPIAPPIEAANGTFYGVTTIQSVSYSTVYSVTSAGVFKTLHTFSGPDGQNVDAVVQGTDGNFYGDACGGGIKSDGVIFRMTPAGTVTVLHNFDGTDGSGACYPLIQATDGNFYGIGNTGGTSNAGVIFRITPGGTYTVIHNLNGTTDGSNPNAALVQATDGNLYGVTSQQGDYNTGTVFRVTTSGTFKTLYSFTGSTDGGYPQSPLVQHTNGLLYGATFTGGDLSCYTQIYVDGEYVITAGCGEVYSLNIGAKPFLKLSATSGRVGGTLGIFGQGFSSSSIVKFNGEEATKIVLTGTTYITATIPTGATNGRVTVTTGSTTLSSAQNFVVHNTWHQGKAIPTAVYHADVGVINGKIYVVGGYTGSATLNDNQVYTPSSNSWSTEAVLPVTNSGAATAVVNNILYVIGGTDNGTTVTNAMWAYNPTTNTWSSKAAALTARQDAIAVVDANIIYVFGGNDAGTGRLANVESYNPVTNTWKAEAPLPVGKSEPSAGLLGSMIVVADGYGSSGDTGDNQAYIPSTNTWKALAKDPTPRNAACSGGTGPLYVIGGYNPGVSQSAITLNESYGVSTNSWATLAPMPQASMNAGSAFYSGQLYCMGGETGFEGTVLTNVQIYQP